MTFTNPLTGETLDVEVPARVGPTRVRFALPPHQAGPPNHFHERFDETFEVVEGELALVVNGHPITLRRGERVTVRAGTPHSFANASDAGVVFRTTVADQGGFQRFIRGWYGLAIDGRASATGPRNLLELAVLIEEGDVCLPGIPLWLQRTLRGGLMRLAAWTGALDRVRAWW